MYLNGIWAIGPFKGPASFWARINPAFLLSGDFFKINIFKNFYQEHYQSVLIWVQTVCKGYQQVTKVATSKQRVKTDKCQTCQIIYPTKPFAATFSIIHSECQVVINEEYYLVGVHYN